MRTLTKVQKHFSFCEKNGIKVYPVYDKFKWYIEVSFKTKKKRFPKPIGVGKVLKGKDCVDAIHKTLEHYYNKLN